jgi:hypothetical protein
MKSYLTALATTVWLTVGVEVLALTYQELFIAADEKGTIETLVNFP